MDDIPPPPAPDSSPGVPTPGLTTAPTARPAAVTGAAAILMIAGALVLFFGAMSLSGERMNIDAPFFDADDSGRLAAMVLVVQGALSLLAGWWVLRLRPAGRVLGIVLVVVGILAGLAQLRRSGSSGFLTIALDAFVLYALFTYGFLFKQPPAAR
jgi:hypothetical protein